MPVANINPAAFGVPASPAMSRYGRAIANMYSDIVNCWPCDDATGATALRNLVSGNITLSTLSNSTAGRPSVLGGDPLGRSVALSPGAAYNSSAYTMPAVGTLEVLVADLSLASAVADCSLFGNWNGSGIAMLSVAVNTIRIYKDATNASYTFVAADRKPVMHMATTWDGVTQRLVINGLQRQTQAVGSPAAGGAVGLGVYSSALHVVGGRFAWATIYNRALTVSELAAHAALVVQPS